VIRTEIDGVPVLWERGPEPMTAALVFRVGARDETFRTTGVTHLIEHLVMASLDRSPLDRNAMVDLNSTVFHATGRPEAVVDFINRVCAALSDLPLGRLEKESRVLRAEEGIAEHPALAVALCARYGYRAQGLAGAAGPGPEQLSRTHVVDHARRYFTRANAVLVLSAEPPPGLRIALPDGTRPELAVAPHLDLRLPGRLTADHPVVSLSGLVMVPHAASMTAQVLVGRLEDELRDARGLSYEVSSGGAPTVEDETMVAVWADGRDDDLPAVAEAMWRAVARLAGSGPTEPELAHALDVAREDLDDPRSIVGWLVHQAVRLLMGREPRSRSDQRSLDGLVDAEQVRRAATQIRDSALLYVPDKPVELPDVPDISDDDHPTGAPLGDTVFRKKALAFAPRDLAVHIGDDGISLTAAGTTSSATWPEVVGVAELPGAREVVIGDGRVLPVIAKHLRGGERLVSLIDERAGGLLFTPEPEGPED